MSIPKEGSRDIGDGIIISLTPDVCLTPVGSSSVPVPYSVFAYQSDDANTAATVRMTGKRAHNLASVVTATKGDAPGSSGGVVSGTVGAACHPKGHSATVNVQGKPAVRHGDEWYMNNKNTVGKLTYVKSGETWEPTPAIILAQNPALEAPDQETVDSYTDAILGGMERAREEGLPEGSYQVAQALPQRLMPTFNPADRLGRIPNSMPSIRPPAGRPPNPANNNARPAQPQPNRVARESSLKSAPPQQVGSASAPMPGGAAGQAISQLWSYADELMSGNPLEVSPDIYREAAAAEAALRQWALDYSEANGGASVPEYVWGPEQDSLNSVRLPGLQSVRDAMRNPAEARAILRDYAEMHGIETGDLTEAQIREILASDDPMSVTIVQSEATAEQVRVTRNEERRRKRPCVVQRYGSLVCPNGEQAHHIVPDSVLRYGNREEGEANLKRIPGLPWFRDGMAICLTGNAADRTGEHGIAHGVTDPLIKLAELNSAVRGTASLGAATAAGIAGAAAARPECLPEITAAVAKQFGPIGIDRLVNAANRPARGAALDALMKGI